MSNNTPKRQDPFHVAVKKELCGVFRALEKPFYDGYSTLAIP